MTQKPFDADEDRRSELMELTEVAVAALARRGQLETAAKPRGKQRTR